MSIPNKGGVNFVLFHLSNKLTLLTLLLASFKDVNYLDFLQHIYIELLRQGVIYDRDDHFKIEQEILSAVATHYKDGGLTLFENFVANNNLPEEKLKRFQNRCCLDRFSWPDTLIGLGMEVFLRKVLFYGTLPKGNAKHAQLVARDPIAHANYLQALTPVSPTPEDLSYLYAYFKIYLGPYEKYENVIEACVALTKQWATLIGPRYQGPRDTEKWTTKPISQVIKKYADLRILEIAQSKAQAKSNVDRMIPDDVKAFLNPKNKMTLFMSSRSAYKLISAFFTDPLAAGIILEKKRTRVEKRLGP